ncbi:MAG: alanine racemase [Kiritimatiellae bacterium]|nr:alanine racemase [Kiritimatiellia bacterium]
MYRSWVEVDLTGLRGNLSAIRRALPRSTELVLVVKADAYGHGIPAIARSAVAEGVRWFGVVHMDEAEAVREASADTRIVMLGPPPPEAAGWLLERNIIPVLVSLDHARALSAEAARRGGKISAHVKLDTGMGRLGLDASAAAAALREMLVLPGIRVDGLCTHFARVDLDGEDPAAEQVARFREIARDAEAAAGRSLFKHVSSSRAALYRPAWDFDGVRPGLIAYGYGASNEDGRIRTRPVLQWKARVVQVRSVPANFAVGYYGTYRTPAPTTLAVVGLGYADGYLRALSNRGHILIGGRRCRVVGRVSMNWITVDAGLYGRVKEGDEAVVMGRQGNQELWADELATLCRTIPYEILTSISAATERRYVGS